MKNRKKSALCLALCLSLLVPLTVRAADTKTAELAASFESICSGMLMPGESVSDWAVIALNLAGINGVRWRVLRHHPLGVGALGLSMA